MLSNIDLNGENDYKYQDLCIFVDHSRFSEGNWDNTNVKKDVTLKFVHGLSTETVPLILLTVLYIFFTSTHHHRPV